MKKKSIIRVFKTIKGICDSYDCCCRLCVLCTKCPYSRIHMANTDIVDKASEIIKNTMDKEDQTNGKS